MTAPRLAGRPGSLRPGSRVRLRPGRRSDIFDLALAGRLAEVDAVEEDSEGQTHLVVTLVDDEGRDFPTGLGHRFFFAPEEVEPVGGPAGGSRVLVAATGDSFAADDAFGSALLAALGELPLPDEVHLVDFGLRGADLAHRLLAGYGSAVVVGTASLGRPAGTLDLTEYGGATAVNGTAGAAESAGPFCRLAAAERLARARQTPLPRLFVLTCEPSPSRSGKAVEGAVELLADLLGSLCSGPLPSRNPVTHRENTP
ncbi:hypothetical protein [Streptomyces sp. NRRL S-337]|uniref:hypothetical protein n=1 Tax=Streptomyces sp. NRRL S-337 TaxID=1463900 RepID=UPI00068F8244|nr:hypothetical protein [Streptomyces sp. NRRL S-337]